MWCVRRERTEKNVGVMKRRKNLYDDAFVAMVLGSLLSTMGGMEVAKKMTIAVIEINGKLS